MTIEGETRDKVGADRRPLALGACLLAVGLLAVPALAGTLNGSHRAERLEGTKHNDLIRGHGGADVLIGKGGRDTLRGAEGADRLRGDKGEDAHKGGRGDDTIRARDGADDLVDCGPGNDTAVVDEIEDGVYDCEQVQEPEAG